MLYRSASSFPVKNNNVSLYSSERHMLSDKVATLWSEMLFCVGQPSCRFSHLLRVQNRFQIENQMKTSKRPGSFENNTSMLSNVIIFYNIKISTMIT